MISQDERIRDEFQQIASGMGETSVFCTVEDGELTLEGVVSSDEISIQLEGAARQIPGIRSVRNALLVEGFSAEVDNVVEGVDLTPDMNAEAGAADIMEATAEADPYFPPTDPVVKPDRSTDGVQMVGGFAQTADPDAATAGLPGLPRGDDEIRTAVLDALKADAYTTDMSVEVEVEDGIVFLRGTVQSLEDVDLIESVAANVPMVEEVREELQVEGM